jgi:hypothetical protein
LRFACSFFFAVSKGFHSWSINHHHSQQQENHLSISTMMSDFAILCAWLVSAGCAIVFPLLRWNASRSKYYGYYGRYNEYEQQQRAYEEAQNQAQQNYNNNNNNNGYNNQQYQYNGNGGYYNYSCKWYQWSCRKSSNNMYYYQQASGDGNQNAFYAPTWYRMINGEMQVDDREREEMGLASSADQASGTLKFVYAWTMIMFISLVLFGALVLWKRNAGGPTALFVMLILFGQMALLQLLMLGQGVIVTDMREMEDSIYGWYGQLGVLMAYSNFWYMIFSFGFAILFGLLSCCSSIMHRNSSSSSTAGRAGDDNGSSWTSRNSKAAGLSESSYNAADGAGSGGGFMGVMSGAAVAFGAYVGSFMARYNRKQDLSSQEPYNPNASSYSVPSVQSSSPYTTSSNNNASMRSMQSAAGSGSTKSGFQASCMDLGDKIADYTTSADPPSSSNSDNNHSSSRSLREEGNLAL